MHRFLGAWAGSMTSPSVGLIMGSQSDWPTLRAASQILDALGVPYEKRIVSAHRTPDRMSAYAKEAAGRGIKVIIAAAGRGGPSARHDRCDDGAARPRRAGSKSKALKGHDSLLSIVQMPGGVPGRDLRHRRGRRQERGASRPPRSWLCRTRRWPGAWRAGARTRRAPSRRAVRYHDRGSARRHDRHTGRAANWAACSPSPLRASD